VAITQINPNSFQASIAVDWKNKQALVVDDFYSFRSNVKEMLRSFGLMHIDEAGSGDDAIAKIAQKKYHVILCDYNLGDGKDGQQVLEEARYQGYVDHSTIYIMITAENTINMVMGALEYEPDDYLIKPFPKGVLERKLRDWVLKKEDLKGIEKALKEEDYGKVVALCDALIDGNPKNLAQFLKIKGESLIKKGDYPGAAAFYEKLLTMGNLPWALLGLGKIRFIIGEYDGAEAIFNNIIGQNEKIVTAYDWLAKVYEKKGDLAAAQEILQRAVSISPKAILRQKTLGDIAYRNMDLTVAEKSLREVVKQGKNSVFKRPSDYTSLAKLLTDKDNQEEGLKVLQDAGREFSDNREARLQISAAEIVALKKMKRGTEAQKIMEKVLKISSQSSERLLTDTELELAKALILMGDENGGNAVIKRLIQNNHEDQALMAGVQAVFKELNMEDKGQEMIAALRDEVIVINNQGVKFVREGNLRGALELFDKITEQLPDNKVINANAVHALILYMKQRGSEPELLKKVKEYLERIQGIDPSYKDLKILANNYVELVRGGIRT